MSESGLVFNPPPGWPKPPPNWKPPKGWTPDSSWPDPPEGWQLWVSQHVPRPNEVAAELPTEQAPPAMEEEGADRHSRVAFLEAEITALKKQLQVVQSAEDIEAFNDEWVLQEAGIYRYHHPLENAAAYQDRLRDLSSRIAEMVKSKKAIEKSETFTFDNSLAKGRKMVNDLARIMLRAYNAEADNSIRALRAGNVQAAKKRLERSRQAIARYGDLMQMHISDAFHTLRLQEVELTADFLMKKQEEREAAREERARLREERRVAQELAAERERLDKERRHIFNALEALKASGGESLELEGRLAEIDDAIEQNDFRSANIRAGYVYVISNRGAFGEGVVKIGLTRRLQPMERVTELGGAAVPFRFDTHALFFSEDAVSLEADLHAHFASRRVNMVNERKEFFFATAAEVRVVLVSKLGNLLEFTENAESSEFLQSRRYWPGDSTVRSAQVLQEDGEDGAAAGAAGDAGHHPEHVADADDAGDEGVFRVVRG